MDAGGHDVLPVKDNQPNLKEAIEAELTADELTASESVFSPEMRRRREGLTRTATTLEKSRGRIEKRALKVTTNLTEHLDWLGVCQVFVLICERSERA